MCNRYSSEKLYTCAFKRHVIKITTVNTRFVDLKTQKYKVSLLIAQCLRGKNP
jgi:hypothetical protein